MSVTLSDLPLQRIRGALLGDQGFIRPILTEDLSEMNFDLNSPLRKNMEDSRHQSQILRGSHCLGAPRYREYHRTACGTLLSRIYRKHGNSGSWFLVSTGSPCPYLVCFYQKPREPNAKFRMVYSGVKAVSYTHLTLPTSDLV